MSAGRTLRRAAAGDVPAMVEIERASFSDPWSAASFRALLDSPIGRVTVAELDGALLGYAVAWRVDAEAELANIAVAPGARRTGVAAALLDELLEEYDRPPAASVFLEVREGNVAAQALYASRGFTTVGRRAGYYRRPTEDALVMRRPVGDA